MKKFLLIFLCLVSFPAIAEEKIFISSNIVEEVINTFVSPENRQSSADTYEAEMDRTTGEISIMGLYKVCIASGFDIQTETGYQSCRQFVFKMLEDVKKQSGDKDSLCTQTMNGVWVNGKCLGRDGQELVYGRACSTNKGKCIKVFDSLQTQPAVGKEFIYEYGRKNGLNLTCSNEQPETRRGITSPLGQDYIKCSAGGIAYEFEFDDLKQEIGTKSVKSENTAICALYGGTDKGDSDNWFQCETSQENCGKITSFLSRIGRNGMYQGYCRLSTEAPNTSVPFLNTLPGVDNRVFYQAGIQVRSDVAKQQLEEYLRGIYPNEANITCGPGIQELNQANSLKDYIMTCTVGGKKVDFVFDDLTEQNDKQVNIDLTGMKCIVSGGNYDGKYCKWLTEKECLDLGKSIEGGTKWDKGAGACILNNAKKYNDLKNGLIMAGGTVAVVAITVASGGTSTIVLAAVAVDAGFNIAFAAFERLQETNPQHRALAFIKDAQNCNDSTCAKFVIQSHFARLDEIVQDLSDDMQDAIMIKFDELSSLLTQEEFEEALEASNLKVGDYALKAGGIMLFLGGIFATPEKALTRMFGKAPRIVSKLTRWINNTPKAYVKIFGQNAEFVEHSSLGRPYYKVFIDGDISEGQRLSKIFQEQSLYVSSGIDGNRPYLAVSESDIFGAWNNASTNWLKNIDGGTIVVSDINILKQKASKSFDTYLQNYLQTGKSVGLPVERLTEAEWENLNKLLIEQDNIVLVRKGEYMAFTSVAEKASGTPSVLSKYGAVLRGGTENSLGHDYYRIAVNNNTDVERIVQELQEQGFYVSSNMDQSGNRFLGVSDKNIFGAWENSSSNWLKNTGRTVGQTGRALEGFYKYGDGLDISTRRYTEYQAEQLTNNLINNGYYATNIGVRGTAEGDEYIVIAASKEQINNLPYQVVESNGTLYRQLNKSRQINSAVDKVGTEITRFGRHKAVLQDIGVIDGRPIAVVKVDKAYIPFYVSTGTAGKTNIPTGRWEVFGGIAPNGWFAKGSEANIINQYGSAEFTEIANALDRSIGDLRDMELVLETAGRQSLGGIGNVAEASDFKSISTDLINRTTGGGVYGLYQIMGYLRQLR